MMSLAINKLATLLILATINVNRMSAVSISKLKCPDSDYAPLQVLTRVTPRGIDSVGQFLKMPDHKSLLSCTQSCCQRTECNVVFFHNNSCFHITCISMKQCEPVKRSSTKFAKTSMVFVRNMHDKTEPPLFQDDYIESDDEYTDTKQRRENRVNPLVSDYPSVADTERTVIDSDVICNIGVDECPENEFCKKSSNRRRQGICVCNKGWVRGVDGVCLLSEEYQSDDDSKFFGLDSRSIDKLAPPPNDKNSSAAAKTTPTPVPTHLVVSAGRNQVIELPTDSTVISAFVMPAKDSYKYEWQLISKPSTSEQVGNMEGSNTDHIKLSHLTAGNYTFKVLVTDQSADPPLVGTSTVNVTVLPPKRVNRPPVAVIQPANSTVQLPNKDTVLDGSFSTDDNANKIVKYEWQALTVPIGYKNVELPSSPTLQLKDLMPGLYQLKLTVTDTDGAQNSTIANITVLKEIDYPPTANAGQDQILFLPNREITLMGNQSTDDKGITLWQWTRAADTTEPKLAVDMDGTNTPFLHLSKLEVGVYKFVLKVTDTSDQSSTAEVHVFVKPESNRPPIAVTDQQIKVELPVKGPIVLDGSRSNDDAAITRWQWTQVSGPKIYDLIDGNTSKAYLSDKPLPGEYEFRLTVWDSKGINASSTVKVSVIQSKNSPPTANAGGDRTVTLPISEVILNGSASTDDVSIVSYRWQRTPESLAFGDIIANSSYSPILRLTNLIVGRYLFRLTVTDSQGSQASDVASLIVKSSEDMSDQIELILNDDVKTFTADQENNVLKRLELLINDGNGQPVRVELISRQATTHSRRVILAFLVRNANTNKRLSGRKVVKELKQKLKTDSSLITPQVISIETLVCQNECSNHGSCDQYTKRCLCEAFWMEDIIRYHLGDRESNCDWSVLYVIIISFLLVCALTAIFWTCVCCISRVRSARPKVKSKRYRKSRRNRYTLLEDDYDVCGADRIELLTNNVLDANCRSNNRSISSSPDRSSDDCQSDTLFDTKQTIDLLNNRLNSNQSENNNKKRHHKELNALLGRDSKQVRA